MIADVLINKKLNPIVTELFIRGRKLIISLFIKQSYFDVPRNTRKNYTHRFIIKQELAFNYSSDIEFKDFLKLHKIYTAKPYSILVRKLSIYLMIILQLHLHLNMHHFKGKDLYLITSSSRTVKSR